MQSEITAAHKRVKAIVPFTGESGRNQIWQALNESADPCQTIETIQEEFSLNLPDSQSAIQLLLAMDSDLSSVSLSLFEGVSAYLESLIGKLDQGALEELLHETVEYIAVKDLKSIPIAVMKKMTVIPEKYLKELVLSDTLKVRISSICSYFCIVANNHISLYSFAGFSY